MPEAVFMVETVALRTYTLVGEAYTNEFTAPESRAKVDEAIAALRFDDAGRALPMAPGLLAMEAIKELRLPKVTQIAISSDLAPYGLVGIEANYRNGRARVYLLDRGSDAITLASDLWPSARRGLGER